MITNEELQYLFTPGKKVIKIYPIEYWKEKATAATRNEITVDGVPFLSGCESSLDTTKMSRFFGEIHEITVVDDILEQLPGRTEYFSIVSAPTWEWDMSAIQEILYQETNPERFL